MGIKTRKEMTLKIDERRELLYEMSDLKGKMHQLEHEIKADLISSGNIDMLTINWTRMNRAYR